MIQIGFRTKRLNEGFLNSHRIPYLNMLSLLFAIPSFGKTYPKFTTGVNGFEKKQLLMQDSVKENINSRELKHASSQDKKLLKTKRNSITFSGVHKFMLMLLKKL